MSNSGEWDIEADARRIAERFVNHLDLLIETRIRGRDDTTIAEIRAGLLDSLVDTIKFYALAHSIELAREAAKRAANQQRPTEPPAISWTPTD